MDFSEFQKKVESRKVILVELKPALDLTIMTRSTGTYSWYLDVDKIDRRDSGFYFFPQFTQVFEDSTLLTQVTGPASVDSTSGSWYFNSETGRLFLHTSDSATPSTHSVFAVFPLHFSNESFTGNDCFYNPRISDVPVSLSSNADDIFFSTTTVGGGSISFENLDSMFDKLSCKYIWKNRDISIAIGEKSMTSGSYATVFSGRLRDRNMTDKSVTFSIQDKREYLHKNLPVRVLSKKDYPNMNTAYEGKIIPILYGYIEKGIAYKVNTIQKGKFKFADHPVHAVTNVYNNDYEIPSTYYTIDLDNGELTVLSGYGQTMGQVTVTFYGVPGETMLFSDDFNDGNIEGWTSQATGGSYSWTPFNQKVRASSQDGYITFLWAPKQFSRGTLEVKITPQSGTSNAFAQGIIWDFQDTDNYKYLAILPNLDKIRLYERSNGSSNVKSAADVVLDLGTEYTIKLEISSKGMTKGYLNGVEKVSYNFDSYFPFRKCGLIHLNGNYSDFDDFYLKLPYISTGPQIAKDICTRWLQIPESDIDTASFDYSLQKARERLTVYLGSSQERSEQVIGKIGTSNLCRFLIGSNGKVYYSFWDENDTVCLELNDELLLDTFVVFDQTDDIFYKTIVNYGATPQSPSGTDEEYSEEPVLHTYSRPYEKKFLTYIVDKDDAEKIALKLFQLVKAPVLRVKVQTKMCGIDLKVGDIVSLKRKRGFTPSGTVNDKFRIIGITKEIDLTRTTLTLISENEALGIDICNQNCQYGCEVSCLAGCQAVCQTACQLSCQTSCQISCKSTCQINCQTACETSCETGCEVICENCEGACQTGCEISCQETCQLSCQSACQLGCQLICQLGCRTYCEMTCQESSLG